MHSDPRTLFSIYECDLPFINWRDKWFHFKAIQWFCAIFSEDSTLEEQCSVIGVLLGKVLDQVKYFLGCLYNTGRAVWLVRVFTSELIVLKATEQVWGGYADYFFDS